MQTVTHTHAMKTNRSSMRDKAQSLTPVFSAGLVPLVWSPTTQREMKQFPEISSHDFNLAIPSLKLSK